MAGGTAQSDPIIGVTCEPPAKDRGGALVEHLHGSTKDEGRAGAMDFLPKTTKERRGVQGRGRKFGGHVVESR